MHHEGLLVLPKVLEVAGIRKCILVGHSDGGSIAIIYSGGTQAAPVLGLITEAAHVFCEEITIRSIEQAKANYEQTELRQRLKKYHGSNTDCAFWGWNGVWLSPDFMNWNIEEYLSGIKVPALVIQGADDAYGTLAQVEAISKQSGAETEIKVFKECGHAPHKDQTKKTFEAMRDFILKALGTYPD
jgi:pimeloyl-ACP methyl ester carboxylesterase